MTKDPLKQLKSFTRRPPGPLRYTAKSAVKKTRVVEGRPEGGKRGGIVATLEGDTIVLRLPLIPEANRKPSSTGKSTLCASTRGPRKVQQIGPEGELVVCEIDGKPLRIIASAFVALGAVSDEKTDEATEVSGI